MGLNGVPCFDKPSYSWLQINGIQKFTTVDWFAQKDFGRCQALIRLDGWEFGSLVRNLIHSSIATLTHQRKDLKSLKIHHQHLMVGATADHDCPLPPCPLSHSYLPYLI